MNVHEMKVYFALYLAGVAIYVQDRIAQSTSLNSYSCQSQTIQTSISHKIFIHVSLQSLFCSVPACGYSIAFMCVRVRGNAIGND